ncbi:MAG: hypothetical protein HOP29_19190 [Phycisphaerales bacterium]|nr:hypothetical protein [Phycisphaerales bacterium]
MKFVAGKGMTARIEWAGDVPDMIFHKVYRYPPRCPPRPLWPRFYPFAVSAFERFSVSAFSSHNLHSCAPAPR